VLIMAPAGLDGSLEGGGWTGASTSLAAQLLLASAWLCWFRLDWEAGC
jgi:hypothetical protein